MADAEAVDEGVAEGTTDCTAVASLSVPLAFLVGPVYGTAVTPVLLEQAAGWNWLDVAETKVISAHWGGQYISMIEF